MNILDALLGEHAALLTLFEFIDRDSAHMGLDRLHETGLLLERMLLAHATLEDHLLFDSVPDARGGLKAALDAMHEEHIELGSELGRLREAASEPAARGALARVLAVTREHFAVEERVLFALVAQRLGAEKLAELGAAWKRRRLPEAAA